MVCTHCQQSVLVASARFCPGCGLPLNQDRTVMSHSEPILVSDDENQPNPLVVAGGIVGVLALAVGLMFMSGQIGGDGGNRRRAAVPAVPMLPRQSYMAAPPVTAFAPQMNPYAATPAPTMPPARYAHTPAMPNRQQLMARYYWDMTPPPSHPLNMTLLRRHQPAFVARVTTAYPMSPANYWSTVRPVYPVIRQAPFTQPTSQNWRNESRGYQYDPVHDSWALRPDFQAPSAPVPTAGGATF